MVPLVETLPHEQKKELYYVCNVYLCIYIVMLPMCLWGSPDDSHKLYKNNLLIADPGIVSWRVDILL